MWFEVKPEERGGEAGEEGTEGDEQAREVGEAGDERWTLHGRHQHTWNMANS